VAHEDDALALCVIAGMHGVQALREPLFRLVRAEAEQRAFAENVPLEYVDLVDAVAVLFLSRMVQEGTVVPGHVEGRADGGDALHALLLLLAGVGEGVTVEGTPEIVPAPVRNQEDARSFRVPAGIIVVEAFGSEFFPLANGAEGLDLIRVLRRQGVFPVLP